MYTNPQSGQPTVAAVAPTLHLATFRRNILAVVVGNLLFTDAEQLRCNDSVHQSEDTYRLAVWLKNVRRVAHEREQAAVLAALAVKVTPQPAPLSPAVLAPDAPASEAQRQALRILSRKVHPVHRANVVSDFATLTYAQAVRRVGNTYLLATRQPGNFTRSLLVSPELASPELPQGSLLRLHPTAGDALGKGELAYCQGRVGEAAVLGRVSQLRRGKYYPDNTVTLGQGTARQHVLWQHRPWLAWFRVEIISLAC